MGKYEKKRTKKNSDKWLWLLAAVVVVGVGIFVALTQEGDGRNQTQQTMLTESTTETTVVQMAETETTVAVPDEMEQMTFVPLELEKIEQQEDRMVVYTSYAVLDYPFAFSDLIHIAVDNRDDQAVLRFFAVMGDTEYPVFNLVFNAESEIRLGTIFLNDMMPEVLVCAELCDADESLNAEQLPSFYAAQETFNDIVTSLTGNAVFTPAE